MVTWFLHLACQGGGSNPCTPVSYATGSDIIREFASM